ncbi:hypothetical protein Chor_017338 [Crotalus horridus]
MASTSVLVNREETGGVATGTYSYCSQPRALPNRQRYRTTLEANELEEEPVHYANLMYERRVVRGNTYALHVLPWLFDFDIEVKPMLEVLVGKTIEQALLEVMEEEELANLRAHQSNPQQFLGGGKKKQSKGHPFYGPW